MATERKLNQVEEALALKIAKHISWLGEVEFHMALPAERAYTLIAQLALALRHPSNKGVSSQWARAFIDSMLANFAFHDPELAKTIEYTLFAMHQ